MFDAIRDEIRRHRARFGRKLHVGVFKLGGHGDFMQQLAFARAARRRWPRNQATLTLITKLSSPVPPGGPSFPLPPGEGQGEGRWKSDRGHDPALTLSLPHPNPLPGGEGNEGRPSPYPLPGGEGKEDVTEQILRGCDFVDSCLEVPATDWRVAVQELAPAFDVFYDVQYVAGTYFRNPRRFAAEQAEANARLARYAYYYSRFPWSNAELAETGQSQWEMLARSSGLDVSEEDLFIQPTRNAEGGTRNEEAKQPDSSAVPSSEFALPRSYVTLHNAAGGGAVLKCLPPATFDAIARRLQKLGVVAVQVGVPRERAMAGCVDLRGLTINETAAVIAGARLHVDLEGGLVYVARAVGTRSVVFFGPTPAVTFGFRGNVNLSLGRCRPCWWSREHWERACPKGHSHCRNLPDEAEAVAAVEKGLSVAGCRLSG